MMRIRLLKRVFRLSTFVFFLPCAFLNVICKHGFVLETQHEILFLINLVPRTFLIFYNLNKIRQEWEEFRFVLF